jgi:hypothetical protein
MKNAVQGDSAAARVRGGTRDCDGPLGPSLILRQRNASITGSTSAK